MQSLVMDLAFVFLFAGSAVFCNQLARPRNKNPAFWSIMGLLLGPVALLLILFSRSGEQ